MPAWIVVGGAFGVTVIVGHLQQRLDRPTSATVMLSRACRRDSRSSDAEIFAHCDAQRFRQIEPTPRCTDQVAFGNGGSGWRTRDVGVIVSARVGREQTETRDHETDRSGQHGPGAYSMARRVAMSNVVTAGTDPDDVGSEAGGNVLIIGSPTVDHVTPRVFTATSVIPVSNLMSSGVWCGRVPCDVAHAVVVDRPSTGVIDVVRHTPAMLLNVTGWFVVSPAASLLSHISQRDRISLVDDVLLAAARVGIDAREAGCARVSATSSAHAVGRRRATDPEVDRRGAVSCSPQAKPQNHK